ncbi:MAG: rod shape-determining protein RodA [Candidatus Aminicenantes bacterium RBG_13_63_10]|nr:MAG: rod shape-determining protein RodA [Candidatus Aminicenantes bacterium RBG_13_63_10]
MINRKLLGEMDWLLLGILLLNTVLGCILIYSASHFLPTPYHLRQAVWVVVCLGGLLLTLLVDYKTLITYSPFFYGAGILMLAGLLVWGRMIAGTKSWFRLSSFGIQPSELTKVFLILILARLFSEYRRNRISSGMVVLSGGLVGLPLALVAAQPDLGTAFSYLPLLLAVFILAGMSRKMAVILLLLAIGFGFLGWNVFLHDYQKTRLVTLLSPGHDPQGAGYQIQQSKIAIGSGGLLGKGFKQGSQSQLNFLPARHTDFIFAVLGEEMGFAGILAVMAAFFVLLFRLFKMVALARDRAGVYVVFLTAALLSFQFLVNILMVVGLFPVAGVPLPLLSYGGSSLLTTYLCVGLALNVRIRRFANL